MRYPCSTVALGVLAAGLVFSQQACTPTPRPAGPVAFTAPSTADPILEGKRQIVIRPVPSAESIVAVGADGRLGTTDGDTEHGLFVLVPVGDRHQIRTAGGGPSCWSIESDGTVVATGCNSGLAAQLFTITARKSTYAISNQDAYLQISPQNGLTVEKAADATTFAFVDNGVVQSG